MGDPRQTDFFESVARRADLEVTEAEDLTKEFVKSLSSFIDEGSWEIISDLTPVDVEPISIGGHTDAETTMKKLLLEMSDEEGVETRRAARHARAVAETIREHADESQLKELADSIEEEFFLALFESRGRGELTEVNETSSEKER